MRRVMGHLDVLDSAASKRAGSLADNDLWCTDVQTTPFSQESLSAHHQGLRKLTYACALVSVGERTPWLFLEDPCGQQVRDLQGDELAPGHACSRVWESRDP